MEHIGIDVHASESQICRLTAEGEILECRIRTRPDRFEEVLGCRPRARILIEASTESEWVARCLEDLGHEVIVADANDAPMYATRSRRVKTDRRDAQAPMDACRLGAYRPAHRTSDPHRQVRAELAVRDGLVRTRARFISLIRALLRREGLRVRRGMARHFPQRLAALTIPEPLSATIAPLLAVMETLHAQLDAADARLARHTADDPLVRRLQTVPNIGPVTKRGHGRTRWLLVEAAWGVIRQAHPATAELRAWSARIAAVALARRRAGILYALWRDGTDYQPRRMASTTQDTAMGSGRRSEARNRTGGIPPQGESGWVSAQSSLTAVESRWIDGAPTPRISPCAGDRGVTPVERG